MATVRLKNLTKEYADAKGGVVQAVKGIELAIEDREFMVLVGPSGCGKSTTLRMIAGLEEISGGELAIDGRVVNDVPPKDRDIAMVFQNYALYPHMSVYDNMAFGLKLRKFPKADIDRRVREAAAMLGLEALLERQPKALSGGQRQRVALGRAIVRHPKVFLFDEPLSNLDAKMRVATRAEISRLHARLGATMIYVTHDQVEAMTMGDRICVMKDGRIMQVARPLELYNRPDNLFTAGFIGSPPMNFFRGTVRHENGHRRFVEGSGDAPAFTLALPDDQLPAASPSRRVILGIRPENLRRADGPAAGPAATILAEVDFAEPMGAETFVHLRTGGTNFVARLDPGREYRRLDRLTVAFDLRSAHLFDAETEQVIR